MNRKKHVTVLRMVVVIIAVYVIQWSFFDIQRIKGQEILQEALSPDGAYTVTIYLNNGGATTSYAILGTVRNNETGKVRNIYWMYPCEEMQVQWKDGTTVVINDVELDVRKDSYDYRRD